MSCRCSSSSPFRVFGSVERELESQLAIQLAQRGSTLDQIAAIILFGVAAGTHRRMGGEFTDNFFEYVFQRDQSL